MWGSRLLFRGYGSSRRAWPRAAGLLAMDSVVVVDEAHLSRQLLCTARRVARLVAVATDAVPVRSLQVVETTATSAAPSRPDQGAGTVVGVSLADLDEHGTLTDRLTRPKPVTVAPVPGWPGMGESARRTTAQALADHVIASWQAPAETTVELSDTIGCFVNTVSAAVDLTAELRRRKRVDGREPAVVMLCGQVRPHDLDRLRSEHPGVLGPQGSPDVNVIVATQTLEVGVDIDLAAMVTELASGSALAQRAGRVNRRGLRAAGPITIVAPQQAIADTTRSGPYGHEDLADARAWIDAVSATDQGLAPSALSVTPPPAARPRRPLYQRPELAQAWHWARTSDDLAAEPELDLWLGEDFESNSSVGVVVRRALPRLLADALRLVDDLPPQRHETFPVPYRTAVSALAQWRGDAQDGKADIAVVVQGDEVSPLVWRVSRDGGPGVEMPAIRPGDVVVVDDSARLFTTSSSGGGGFSPPVVAPVDADGGNLSRHSAEDVLTAQADLPAEVWQRRAIGGVVLRLEEAVLGGTVAFADLAADLAAVTDDPSMSGPEVARAERTAVSDWLTRSGLAAGWPMAAFATDLLRQESVTSELVIHRDLEEPEDGSPAPIVRVLVRDRRRLDSDEGLRQVFSTSRRPVTLVAHQAAVAERAAIIGETVGLPSDLVTGLRLAGAHHDDGKADPRFQRRLGAHGPDLLAKSRPGTSPEQTRRNEARSGLPARWRHEQRSVVDSWDAVSSEAGERADPLLVQRLVGTSHGFGRSGFPHAGEELLLAGDADATTAQAVDLFDAGHWDDLIERTQQRYGVWGCAYLEALLRAADNQVSQEGS